MIVVDTNVIAHLHLAGPETSAAEAVLAKDSDWIVPPLWRSEFRNVLTQHVARQQLPLATALDLVSDAESLLAGRDRDVGSAAVLQDAAASGRTAYDCEFVVLAKGSGVKLVTEDRKVLRAFPALAVSMEQFVK